MAQKRIPITDATEEMLMDDSQLYYKGEHVTVSKMYGKENGEEYVFETRFKIGNFKPTQVITRLKEDPNSRGRVLIHTGPEGGDGVRTVKLKSLTVDVNIDGDSQ